jgi:hypothetical protein
MAPASAQTGNGVTGVRKRLEGRKGERGGQPTLHSTNPNWRGASGFRPCFRQKSEVVGAFRRIRRRKSRRRAAIRAFSRGPHLG